MNKKIIHIALGKANPARLNGVNKVVNSVVSHQVKNGFDAEFWGISFSDSHNYEERNYRTRLFRDHALKFKISKKLKAAIGKLDPLRTTIHFHGAFIPQFYILSRYLIAAKIPYFFTPHGGYNLKALEKSKLRKRIYINLFERTLVNNATGIQLLGVSEKIGTELHFKNTMNLIPNGQEIYNDNIQYPPTTNTLKIGFLGRIDIQTKGLDILLEGIRSASQFLNIQLEIVGAGGEMSELERMVKSYNLGKHVTFKGALFGTEKLATVKSWDALCLVSRNEGLPGVVLEAASIGVPSIVSNETNMGNYISDYNAGWVLKENNSLNLSIALKQLHESKIKCTLLNYRLAAQQMVKSEFDWNLIVQRLVKAYA